jgi:L-ascorbate metabolism protein UlaG (beta-lactamase superfamily)
MKKLLTTLLMVLTVTAVCAQVRKTDTFQTKSGKNVTITCIKHASLEINYNGTEIQVDPVSDAVKPVTNYYDFPKANIILITHQHQDHFDREAIAALRTSATTIYEPQSVYNMWFNGQPMHNGDSIQIADDILLKAVPAYNTTAGREQFHPKGRDNGYILTLDGLRIYIAGDTEDIPEMADIKDIDIAFLPCNQPYTMTVNQLVSAAKIIKPKVLFPYHYGETTIAQVSMMLGGSGIDVRIRNYQ